MQSLGNTTSWNWQWQDLQQLKLPDESQLDKIKSHLDLVWLALEAIAFVTPEDSSIAAQELNLTAVVGNRQGQNVAEVRSLVIIICHLAKQHQELIRRGVSLLEQVGEPNDEPDYPALLADYAERFTKLYRARNQQQEDLIVQSLSQLAFKLLIDLLFYSGDYGHRLLWLAISPATN